MRDRAVVFPEGRKIIQGPDAMHETMGSFVSLAVAAASADAGSIYVLDGGKQFLIPYVTVGLPEKYISECGAVAMGDQCCGRAALHKQQWIVSDMLSDPLFINAKAAAEQSEVRAAFSTPIIGSDGNCIGSLACHFFGPHTPNTSDLSRNKLWAELIAHMMQEHRELRLRLHSSNAKNNPAA